MRPSRPNSSLSQGPVTACCAIGVLPPPSPVSCSPLPSPTGRSTRSSPTAAVARRASGARSATGSRPVSRRESTFIWSSLPCVAPRSSTSASDRGPATVEGFDSVLRQAEDEGLDLFATAPQPTYRATTPGLCPPHGSPSGLVQAPVDAKRLDACLTADFFARPRWNRSVVHSPQAHDSRTLETIARHRRQNDMEDYLNKRTSSAAGRGKRGASQNHGCLPAAPRCASSSTGGGGASSVGRARTPSSPGVGSVLAH